MTVPEAPTRSADVRERLVRALRLDLVGPDRRLDGEALLNEVLPEAPSQWYLAGFLAPTAAPEEKRRDDDGDEPLDAGGDGGGTDDREEPERPVAQRAFFPASMGLSVLVAAECELLSCTVDWGDYAVEDGKPARWRREPRSETVQVPLEQERRVAVPNSRGLFLVAIERAVATNDVLPKGTRAVSLFIVNERDAKPDQPRDLYFAFQVGLAVASEVPFVPRPDPRGIATDDWDEGVADLQYADVNEFAVGHNVSAEAEVVGGICREVRTTWLPSAFVERVDAASAEAIGGADLVMEKLGSHETDAAGVRRLVGPMVVAYGAWIEGEARRKIEGKKRQQIAAELLKNARRAKERMATGLDALSDDAVMEAFRIANRCVARAIRQRTSHGEPGKRPEDVAPPEWRPFQLAFLLLNLKGMADPTHADRRTVDLLFFPTGGGKTEAYLGLAAFGIALRRLRDPSVRSSGVTVLMRYTLRLLTLDQLSRAATLICALELERQKDVAKLGSWPIEIGLWVGQTATPNRMGKKGEDDRYTARSKVRAFKREPKAKPSPIPLENCPWCGARFVADSFNLLPNDDEPEQLRVFCGSRDCEFHPRRQREGLPLHAVDEPIYRRLPAFVIATVDKFASLPWIGRTGALLGCVDRHDPKGFYGDAEPGRGAQLGGPLNPPDLIIQDELHLISGPLGTMVGLYETAIDALCGRPAGAEGLRPKIVASTATVRRAQSQICALFGRPDVDVFPPPGPDRRDTFFSKTRLASDGGARQYLGVAAQGRNLKVVLMRTYIALLAAGKKAWDEARRQKIEPNPADPYTTLVGYFNSLRELGGSRRIVEDEVTARLQDYGTRRRRVEDQDPLFANRPRLTQPAELTSREPTNKVAETKRCLALPYGDGDHLDVALATNMISVGLDITRLGLMVVTGQPKSAAEYIQATSRVGRDAERPGLVVTLLNMHRARDRSHYERFGSWHASFYRAVEATSVTPFSSRAVDRGLAAVAVALARHGRGELTAPRGAERIGKHRGELDFVLEAICRRAEGHVPMDKAEAEQLRRVLRARTADLLDSWATIAQQKGQLQYQREEGGAPPLLRDPMHPDLARVSARERKFKANWSLRDVEPTVKLRSVGAEDADLAGEDPWQ